MNSTVPPSQSPPFEAPLSAVAINLLWFLSLIFSLAAGLFGILVKQWLREYLQWNTVLAPSRENVLVRQIRFEEWHKWKVPAVIAAIPAMLEVAVILFLIGMIAFVWTLQRLIAIVVTIAIAAVIFATSVVTILPVLSCHCPYRTPTGWALVVLFDFLQNLMQIIWDKSDPFRLAALEP